MADSEFENKCLELLEQAVQNQAALGQKIADIEGQNMFVRHQVAQSTQATAQLYGVVNESQTVLRKELGRFQTGGPQRAMAAVFYKLFRDLLKYMNQLDELAALDGEDAYTEEEQVWIRSIQTLRAQFESILCEWGCAPIEIEVGVQEFDPEVHEAVPEDADAPEGVPENTIVRVCRRGWTLQDYVLQYPQVVVS